MESTSELLSQDSLLNSSDSFNEINNNPFEKKNTFLTLIHFSIGPVLFTTGISLHDAVDLYLISKALGTNSLQIVGFASLIRYLCMCTTIYFSQSIIAKLSGLIASGKKKEATQVVSDLFRISFFTMLIIPIFFYFFSIPILQYIGSSYEISIQSRKYLIPIFFLMPFITIFQLSCGFLQSQGLSISSGLFQIGSFFLNCGFLSPILLFIFKIPITFSGFSFAFSQSFLGIILFFRIYQGKYDIKPKWNSLLNPLSKETKTSLILGLPYILNILSNALPPMVLLRYIMKSAESIGFNLQIGAIFSVFLRIQSTINSFSIGINQSLMVCGSYAKNSQNYQRLFGFLKSAISITLTYHLIWMPIMITNPQIISKLYLSENSLIDLSKQLIKIPFLTNFLIPLNDSTTNFLLSYGKPFLAMLPSIFRGISCLINTFILYYTNKKNPIRMMYTYCLNDIIVFIVDIVIIYQYLKNTLKSL